MTFQPKPSFSYTDLGLNPVFKSEIEHRDTVDTSTEFLGLKLSMPLVSAPMATVTGHKLAQELRRLGGLAFLPRSDIFENDLQEYLLSPKDTVVSISATGDYLTRAEKFLENGATRFCIDVANGFHSIVEKAVYNLRQLLKQVDTPTYIVTGNIASFEGYKFLAELGVDAVRVGVSNGAVCATFKSTSIGVGQASLIRDIIFGDFYIFPPKFPTIIADGGIQTPSDLCCALALGSDVVMAGGLFAGTDESAGEIINVNGQFVKRYSGQASKAIKGNSRYIEGYETLTPYKGPVEEIWNSYKNGLQSSMAYMNCKNIEQFKALQDECFVELKDGAKRKSK